MQKIYGYMDCEDFAELQAQLSRSHSRLAYARQTADELRDLRKADQARIKQLEAVANRAMGILCTAPKNGPRMQLEVALVRAGYELPTLMDLTRKVLEESSDAK